MPIYEYRCRACSSQFQELVFGNAQPNCPECKTDDIERAISLTAPGRVKGASAPPPAPEACGTCPGARSCGFE